jgi:outer membrane receptor protein involved in Fe transport
LQQEKFDAYKVVNLVGGKSWKINGYYISVFATLNNLLNTAYKSGGFEQGRNSNYNELSADKALNKALFGNKYWYGRGTTYFLNLNFSF